LKALRQVIESINENFQDRFTSNGTEGTPEMSQPASCNASSR